MIFIEFQPNLKDGMNIIKYKNVNDYEWYYLEIDLETLNLLITNFGVISTYKIPTIKTNCDNMSTSKEIKLKYCGANIIINCNPKLCVNNFYLPDIEQNY